MRTVMSIELAIASKIPRIASPNSIKILAVKGFFWKNRPGLFEGVPYEAQWGCFHVAPTYFAFIFLPSKLCNLNDVLDGLLNCVRNQNIAIEIKMITPIN